MADGGRHLENRYDVIFLQWVDEIGQPGAEQHANYGEMVENETRSRIPIWWTFVFPNGK